MKQLKLGHLAPYLPYGLKILNGWGDIKTLNYTHLDDEGNGFIKHVKPILRPLSDLTKEIEHNGKKLIPSKELDKIRVINIYKPINIDYPIEINIETEDYTQSIDLFDGYLIAQKLLQYHFDFFGLIEQGLAIDINTLDKSYEVQQKE